MALREQIAQQTYSQTDDDFTQDDADYDDVWPTRMPSSARRYDVSQPPFQRPLQQQQQQQTPRQVTPIQRRSLAPGTYTDGRTKLNVKYGAPPTTRKGRTIQTDTEEPQAVRPKRRLHLLRGWRIHPVLYLGIGMILMLLLWVALTSLISFVQLKLDDFSYGYPRTYQLDGVINQNNDSPANPTHIIFLNLNRKIEVIVQPTGDASKAQIYVITTLIESGSELWPVTGYVKDVNDDGKPDIVLTIQGSHTVLINTGTGFRPLKPGEQVNI